MFKNPSWTPQAMLWCTRIKDSKLNFFGKFGWGFFCYDKAEFSHICMNSYRHSELLLPGLLWDTGVAQGTARAVHVQAVIPHQCHCQVLHGGQGEGFVSRLRVCDCLPEQRWHHFFPSGKRRQRRAAWGCGRGMLLSGNCVVSGGEGARHLAPH